jgi:hypothetical protein
MSASQIFMNGRNRLALISRKHLVCWALPAVVACLAVAGCGSSASSSTSASASATQSAGLSAFQTCLKQHGVKITPRASFSPRPRPSGSGFPTAFPTGTGFPGGFASGGANSAAFKACQKYAPAGFRRGGGISASAIAAFKSCMSQNGVKVTSTTFASLAKLRSSSKKAAAAFKICGVLLEQGFSRPTLSPT